MQCAFLCFIFLILTTLQGCATYKPFPLGQVPSPTQPSVTATSQTARSIQLSAVKEGGKVLTSGPAVQRVKKVWNKLLIASGAQPHWFPIAVVDHPTQINAAMVNGSHAQIYSGLLRNCKNDYDLITILSHELAHGLLQHHLNDPEIQSNRRGAAIFGAILGGIAGGLQARQGASYSSARQTSQAFEKLGTKIAEGAGALRYERDQEYDADRVGMMIMAKACYDPTEALIFWRDRSDTVLTANGGFSSFFQTHPFHDERAENLSEALPIALTTFQTQCVNKTSTSQTTKKRRTRKTSRK